MTYLPSNFVSSSFTYSSNGDYIIVRTNQNCYRQGTQQTEYCDCYYVYPNLDYLSSNKYSCTALLGNQIISYSNFTSDFWYRIDISQILIIFVVLFLFIYLFPYKLMSRLFGRWFKL